MEPNQIAGARTQVRPEQTRSPPPPRPPHFDQRHFYVVRAGCAWRLLPKDFGPWQTVYGYFRQWSQDWTWTFIHDTLRDWVRYTEGRSVAPTAAIMITPAAVQDRDAAKPLIKILVKMFGRLQIIWADGGYLGALVRWVKELRPYGKLKLDIVRRCDQVKVFKVLPKRWIVERTFSWFFKSRRLCRDYEIRLDHSEAMLRVCMIRLMVRRLAKPI
jgi:putative transposase